MSGIYGIYRYDGAPIDQEWLRRMETAMAFYGPDGRSCAQQPPVAMGHLASMLNPEDSFARQPVETERGLVASTARLDNRDELLDAFSIGSGDAPQVADSSLAAMAFDRWGQDMPLHLQGDWSLAGWDRRERRLLLARDACGASAFYYYQGQGFLAFASSLKALLALPGVVKEPDYLHLAEILVCWQQYPERTAYSGFLRVMGSHALLVDSGGQSRVWRHWSPAGREPLRYRRDDDYVDEFRALYTQALRSCLRTSKPVAATLSAGRDSGSVVAMAAPLLAEAGKNLTAYTSVPLFPPDGAGKYHEGNEWELAHATATMAGPNVHHCAIDAGGYSVLGGIEYLLDVHDGTGHAAVNFYWIQAVLEAAAQQGAGVLLMGELGNATVSWAGYGSALFALLQGSPATALRLLLHADPTPWHSFRRQIIKPFLMPALRLYRRRKLPLRSPWRAYSALNPELGRELDIDGRMRAAGYDPAFGDYLLRDFRLEMLGPEAALGMGIDSELGSRHGLSLQDPTANLRLIEFLLRVPDDQFKRGDNGSWLFRRAFDGRMPAPVVNSRRKGLQAADVGHRLVREMPALEACLASLDSMPEARRVLDMPLLHRTLAQLRERVDPATTGDAATILVRGINTGLFLRRRAASSGAPC